jgi:hypothetical protein
VIVYFLGAGASYDTLPVVKDFPERLRRRAETMHERARFLDSSMRLFSGKSPEVILSEFTKSLQWLASETSKHLSVDTFTIRKAPFLCSISLGKRMRLRAHIARWQ